MLLSKARSKIRMRQERDKRWKTKKYKKNRTLVKENWEVNEKVFDKCANDPQWKDQRALGTQVSGNRRIGRWKENVIEKVNEIFV